MLDPSTCRVCGAPLERKPVGRPPRYCSTTCRRAAEYALKRHNSHLLRLETQRDTIRRRLATERLPAAWRRRDERELALIDESIASHEDELRRLLDAADDVPSIRGQPAS